MDQAEWAYHRKNCESMARSKIREDNWTGITTGADATERREGQFVVRGRGPMKRFQTQFPSRSAGRHRLEPHTSRQKDGEWQVGGTQAEESFCEVCGFESHIDRIKTAPSLLPRSLLL